MTHSDDNIKSDSELVPNRRDFIKRAAAVALGGAAGLVPLGAGLVVFADPLRKKPGSAGLSRVTSLDSIPADGTPRKFTVEANQTDAWNRFPRTPVGAVYLRRVGANKVHALSVACPHAGCFVDFDPDGKSYFCPCHRSRFSLDGSLGDAKSPSPRGMDELESEVRNDSEVWIRFQNFIAGHKEKIPAA